MMASNDATLAAIATRTEKETAYHLRHAAEWAIRLGDGTAESHGRAQAAVDELWAFTGELFQAPEGERELIAAGIAIDPEGLRATWRRTIEDVLGRATLNVPSSSWVQSGGRAGRHSEHLGHLLTELQYLQRTYPNATW
jgi:ring-1,2-phenylacetyl-CoA epoxidase subunit PaaC